MTAAIKRWISAGIFILLFVSEIQASEITLNFIGDCTLGENYGSGNFSFYYDKYGPSYFFSGVKSVFENADLTIANCEGAFTASETRIEKFGERTFWFKGKPSYAEIFKKGGINVVNLANNHTFDYGSEGYLDTQAALREYDIGYFGNDILLVRRVKRVNIGFYGLCFKDITVKNIENRIRQLQNLGADIIVGAFHTGQENQYLPTVFQQYTAKKAIALGTDVVVQHHPHVVQDVIWYRNKIIAYSLGNFCFGGHANPKDKTSIILRVKIDSNLNMSCETLPVSISDKSYTNSYRPFLYRHTYAHDVFEPDADSGTWTDGRRAVFAKEDRWKAAATKTLLSMAKYASVEEITRLINEGADLSAVNEDGWTPLMLAAYANDNADVLRALIAANADVNAVTENGRTAILNAVHFNQKTDILRVLIDAGADVNLKTEAGNTPLSLAAEHGAHDVVLLLLDAGAKAAKRDVEAAQKNGRLENTDVLARLKERHEQSAAQTEKNAAELYSRGLPSYNAKDYASAFDYFSRAAKAGHADAQSYVGIMYRNGYGVKQSYVQAAEWYRKAADAGNRVAQNDLGYMYENGYGVKQDYVQAAEWYHKAANAEDRVAQNNLGVMYETGRGVRQDYAQAAEWYREAANAGYYVARKNLELLQKEKSCLKTLVNALEKNNGGKDYETIR